MKLIALWLSLAALVALATAASPPPPQASWRFGIRSTLILSPMTTTQFYTGTRGDSVSQWINEFFSDTFQYNTLAVHVNSADNVVYNGANSIRVYLSFDAPSKESANATHAQFVAYFASNEGGTYTATYLNSNLAVLGVGINISAVVYA